jgi:hypothetical protein
LILPPLGREERPETKLNALTGLGFLGIQEIFIEYQEIA